MRQAALVGADRRFVVGIDCRMAANSGIGVYLRNTLRELSAQRREWRFLAYGWPDELERPTAAPNVSHHPFRSKIYSLQQQSEWSRSLASNVSVLWSPHYDVPFICSVPLFVTVHDIAHLANPQARGGIHRQAYAYVMLNWVRARADAVFFVSRYSQAEFHRVIGKPTGPELIVTNGLPHPWSDPRTWLPPTKRRRRYLVFVGNIKPHKNLGGLLKAFERVYRDLDLDLVIVGQQGGFRRGDPAVARAAEELGDRVRFAGSIPDAQLVSLVAGAAALVLPSFYEGFGLPPIEAMAVGCPTVVANIPSLRETCAEASEYVDPSSAIDIARGIARVVSDEGYANHLRSAGRTQSARYNFAASASLIGNEMQRWAKQANEPHLALNRPR